MTKPSTTKYIRWSFPMRFFGDIVMVAGALVHVPLVIGLGLIIILASWAFAFYGHKVV